jgi:hypothetical protein
MLRYVAVIAFVSALLPAFMGSAQNVYPDPDLNRPLRIEIPATSDKETYRIIPCSDEGMLLFFQSTEPAGENKVKWYFTLYDKYLQQSWTRSVPLNAGVDYENYHSGPDTLSLFFQSPEKDRATSSVFQVLRVILRKGTFILNNGEMPIQSSMAVFSVVKQTCYAGLDVKNDQAQLMILDLPTGRQDFFTIGGGTQTSFVALEVDSSDMTLSAVIRKQLTRRFWDNYFVRMNRDGTVIGETLITTLSPERQLAESRMYPLSASENMVAGSYVLTSSVTDQQHQKGIAKATGFFAARFAGLTQTDVKYTNFLDLKSADSFLSERDIIALRKKAVKKNRVAAEYSTDLNLLVHDIIRHGDQFILLGECYYLQYHTESFTDFDFYGRPYTNSYSVFDGYRFTSAIVAAYDISGNLLWDNSMDIRNLLSQNLDPKVSMIFSGDNAIIAYLSEGKIGYKIIRQENTVEKTDYADLELSLPEDRLVNETKSRMVYWYGNYFICYGFQEIKNLSLTGNATKLVFFCNKVQFE